MKIEYDLFSRYRNKFLSYLYRPRKNYYATSKKIMDIASEIHSQ